VSWKRTIASNNEELVIIAKIMDHDVRVRGYNLLFRCQLGALLELEIADSARERQVTVHSAEIDKAAGSCDSRLLAYTSSNTSMVSIKVGGDRGGAPIAKRAPSFCGL
jgi:hypothetical protein